MGLAGYGGTFMLMNAHNPDHSIASVVASAIVFVVLAIASTPLVIPAMAKARRG